MVYHPTLAVVQPMQGNYNLAQNLLPWRGWPKDGTRSLYCQEVSQRLGVTLLSGVTA